MKISRISRRPLTPGIASDGTRQPRRVEFVRTIVAVTLAVGLVGTGAIALPSLAPVVMAGVEIPPTKGPQLEPEDIGDVATITEATRTLGGPLTETVSDIARALPSAAARIAKATTAVTKPIADGVDALPLAARISRATAHEAIKMKKGIIPLIPSKFARAENGISIPVSLTQYCVQGETRRGRQTRHGIVAADPRIFPLARYVEVFLGQEYLGRYLVDDTGGNVLGATLDIWNPDCKEAARFGRHWGSAVLVAREVEQIPNDSLMPTRWDGLAKR
ncbi:MAG TPA: 3D domain-containing protein [Gemmatimonadaceae bacterium]